MEPMSGQGAAVPSVSGGGDGGAGVATLVPRRVVGDPAAELALRSPQASGGVAGAREASEVGKPPVGAAGGWGLGPLRPRRRPGLARGLPRAGPPPGLGAPPRASLLRGAWRGERPPLPLAAGPRARGPRAEGARTGLRRPSRRRRAAALAVEGPPGRLARPASAGVFGRRCSRNRASMK